MLRQRPCRRRGLPSQHQKGLYRHLRYHERNIRNTYRPKPLPLLLRSTKQHTRQRRNKCFPGNDEPNTTTLRVPRTHKPRQMRNRTNKQTNKFYRQPSQQRIPNKRLQLRTSQRLSINKIFLNTTTPPRQHTRRYHYHVQFFPLLTKGTQPRQRNSYEAPKFL